MGCWKTNQRGDSTRTGSRASRNTGMTNWITAKLVGGPMDGVWHFGLTNWNAPAVVIRYLGSSVIDTTRNQLREHDLDLKL